MFSIETSSIYIYICFFFSIVQTYDSTMASYYVIRTLDICLFLGVYPLSLSKWIRNQENETNKT